MTGLVRMVHIYHAARFHRHPDVQGRSLVWNKSPNVVIVESVLDKLISGEEKQLGPGRAKLGSLIV